MASDVVGMVPEIAGELAPTALDPIVLSLDKMSQSVVAGVDGGLADVIRLFVLITDMFVSQPEGLLAEKRGDPFFQMANNRHRKTDEEAFRNDMIRRGEICAVTWPIDLIKSLRKKFAAQFLE